MEAKLASTGDNKESEFQFAGDLSTIIREGDTESDVATPRS